MRRRDADLPRPQGAPCNRPGGFPLLRILTISLAALTVLFAQPAHARLRPDVIAYWDSVARCETGGNWAMRGPTYEGGTGFAVSTWAWWARELGLYGRYPHAWMAPRLVQIRVSAYGWQRYRGKWGCMRVVGFPPR